MQIKITDITPFMRKGWVAMDEDGEWWWYSEKPVKNKSVLQWLSDCDNVYYCIDKAFNIAPADDWTKSLIKVGGK